MTTTTLSLCVNYNQIVEWGDSIRHFHTSRKCHSHKMENWHLKLASLTLTRVAGKTQSYASISSINLFTQLGRKELSARQCHSLDQYVSHHITSTPINRSAHWNYNTSTFPLSTAVAGLYWCNIIFIVLIASLWVLIKDETMVDSRWLFVNCLCELCKCYCFGWQLIFNGYNGI